MLSKRFKSVVSVALFATCGIAPPAYADIQLGLVGNGGIKAICLNGLSVIVTTTGNTCGDGSAIPLELSIVGSQGTTSFDSATGAATFTAPATFSDNVQMSGLQAFSGTSTFNSTVNFVGPAVNFSTAVSFGSSIDTAGISNTGAVLTDTLLATGVGTSSLVIGSQLTVNSGATLNFGGNRLTNVAAGINPTDGVNVAQLNAATSGVSTRVETLEAVAVFHDLEITAVQEVNATQNTRLTAVEGVNATQATQITALAGTTATQASQISAIQALNTTQSSQIGALQAAQDLVSDRVESLFDLRSMDRRDMKQGIAAAMSMAPAPMPSGPGKVAYAVNGASFRGQYAVGGSMTYRLNTQTPTALNVGFSYAGNKNNGVRVGIAGEF